MTSENAGTCHLEVNLRNIFLMAKSNSFGRIYNSSIIVLDTRTTVNREPYKSSTNQLIQNSSKKPLRILQTPMGFIGERIPHPRSPSFPRFSSNLHVYALCNGHKVTFKYKHCPGGQEQLLKTSLT